MVELASEIQGNRVLGPVRWVGGAGGHCGRDAVTSMEARRTMGAKVVSKILVGCMAIGSIGQTGCSE